MEKIMCKQAKNASLEPQVAAQYRMAGNTCMSCWSTDICLEAWEVNNICEQEKEDAKSK